MRMGVAELLCKDTEGIWHLSTPIGQHGRRGIAFKRRVCYFERTMRKGLPDLKIEIDVKETYQDTEIKIICNRLTPDIEKILATLRMLNRQLTVRKEGEIHLLDVCEVIYAESIDKKTFVYTGAEVYESDLKLYELEQQLSQFGFFRASKSCMVQLKYIRSLKADINRKIRATLENGEQIMISRQYADELKKKLGVK